MQDNSNSCGNKTCFQNNRDIKTTVNIPTVYVLHEIFTSFYATCELTHGEGIFDENWQSLKISKLSLKLKAPNSYVVAMARFFASFNDFPSCFLPNAMKRNDKVVYKIS